MTLRVYLEYPVHSFEHQALQKAAYRAMNSLIVDIKKENETFICCCSAAVNVDEEKFLTSVQEFKKDVLDYQLRHQLNNETAPIRNLILGLVFSNTGINRE